ncbi:MAG: AAA family ATPase [Myxococcota bacterium]
MRFLSLDLEAFGHFSDRSIFLDRTRGFHLFYGRNEAGKSTALRGVKGFLFGFPHRSTDTFRHQKLRVGASVLLDDGRELQLLRRKGRKNTLLDGEGQPVDDTVLRAALRGVTPEQYELMFGLTHEQLRLGAQALLEGRGTVGESLFDAGLGGRSVHGVLQKLEEDARLIYTARGQRPLLNTALREHREAEKELRLSGVSPEAWRTQKESLAAARRELADLETKRKSLRQEQAKLLREERLLPDVRRYRSLRSELHALGTMPPLDPSTSERRTAALQAQKSAELLEERLQREIDRQRDRLNTLTIPEPLLTVPADVIEDIHHRKASYRKAERDLPNRRNHWASLVREVQSLRERVGLGETARLSVGLESRIRRLAADHARIAAELRRARTDRHRFSARANQINTSLREAPLPRAITILEAGLSAVRELGAPAARDRDIAQELRSLERRIAEEATHLEPPVAPIESLRERPLPPRATIEDFRRRVGRAEAELERAHDRRRTLRAELLEAQRALDTLTAEGDIPTEEQLGEQRSQRDRLFGVIRRAGERLAERDRSDNPRRSQKAEDAAQRTLGLDAPDTLAFEDAMREADRTSDRLRREAHRVAQRAARLATQKRIVSELEDVEQDIGTIEDERERLGREWVARWERSGIQPGTPEEMAVFVSRAEELRELLARLSRLREEAEGLRDLWGATASQVESALREFDGSLEFESEDASVLRRLGALETVGGSALEEERERRRRRERLEEEQTSVGADLARLDAEILASEEALLEWQAQWDEVVRSLGLPEDTGPEEASAIVDALSLLGKKEDEADSVERQILAMERDADRLANDVDDILRAHLQESFDPELPLEERADTLVRRYRRAEADLDKRQEWHGFLEEQKAQLGEARATQENANAELRTLMEQAGVADLPSLIAAEERSARIKAIAAEAHETRRRLEMAGEADVDALVDELANRDEVALRLRLDELERDLDGLEASLTEASQQVGRQENGLENQRTRATAGQKAAEQQALLAEIRDQLDRYVTLRLATTILRREIAAYREVHQGPVVARTRTLFPRLTGGAYESVRIGLGQEDEEVLLCVRQNGEEATVTTLSDGTRDALFLSLRLATLERHVATMGPVPVVLDDILIQLDDERATAALEVLGEFAGHCQVLFFTHHARLVELAERVVPEHVLCTHDLGSHGEPPKMAGAAPAR